MGDRATQVENIRTFLRDNPLEVTAIKQELDGLFPRAEQPAQPEPDNGNLARIMETLSISRSAKLRKFEKDDNFARFCERFAEYVELTNMDPGNQYPFFLQNVDDRTYSILKSITLTDEQKRDKNQFCALFRRAIYGDEALALKNELRDCKQKLDEKISDYVYRLREKARIAYPDQDEADENCMLAFLRGVRDNNIRRKLNESTVTNFRNAVKLAKKLERVNTMFDQEQPDYTQVLSNQKVNFDENNLENPDKINSRQWREKEKNSVPGDNSGNRSQSRDMSRDSRDQRRRSRSRENSRDRYSDFRSRSRDQSRDRYSRPWNRYHPRKSRSPTPFPRRESRDRYRSRSRERYSRDFSRSPSRNGRNTRTSSREGSKRSYSRERYPSRDMIPPSKGVTCWACGQSGHYATGCPNVKYFVEKDRVRRCDKTDTTLTKSEQTNENDQNFQ